MSKPPRPRRTRRLYDWTAHLEAVQDAAASLSIAMHAETPKARLDALGRAEALLQVYPINDDTWTVCAELRRQFDAGRLAELHKLVSRSLVELRQHVEPMQRAFEARLDQYRAAKAAYEAGRLPVGNQTYL